jgi:4-methyl-5(b-hydroxyethyl)-thiazole monophosphate biosynthesis
VPRVLVPLAEGFEEIEAVTIVDVLRRAGIEVETASLDDVVVRGSHGISITADTTLDRADSNGYDLVALPGGLPGADHLLKDARIQRMLTAMAADGKFVTAICAAPQVLASAGLLDGRAVTSYPGFLDPGKVKYREEPVVIDGKIITSRGPGTAMEFALTLVEKLAGKSKRDELARRMLVDEGR